MSKQQDAVAYFVGQGWTPAQAAGIVASLVAESNLNPAAVGDGGAAYGIAQWHPDRQANFAAVIGKDIRGSSLAEQLAFVHAELTGTEKAAGDALRSCTTAREAGACVSARYERPANKDAEATRRGALAEALFAQYTEEEERVMADSSPSLGATISSAAPIVGAINPIAGLIAGLAGTLIDGFAPKIRKEIARHEGDQAVAASISDAVVSAAKQVTGLADPIAATVEAAKQPETLQKVEDATATYLAQIAPLADRIAAYEDAAVRNSVLSQDAADKREGAKDLRPELARNIWLGVAAGAVVLAAVMLVQIVLRDDHKADNEYVVAFVGLMPYLLARLGDVYGYAFGGVMKAGAADAVRDVLKK